VLYSVGYEMECGLWCGVWFGVGCCAIRVVLFVAWDIVLFVACGVFVSWGVVLFAA